MKKLYYDEGPLTMGCGAAGEFRIGEPKEVADGLAAELLRKGRLKEYVDQAAPVKTTKAKPEKEE